MTRGLEAVLDTTHLMCLMDTYIYPENSISDTFICLKLVFWINSPKIFKFGTNCTSDRQEVIQTERGSGGEGGREGDHQCLRGMVGPVCVQDF